ncbi:MAG: hypothetical protein ACW97O_15495, partial [Candidatus Thorarchaeota archaeon]
HSQAFLIPSDQWSGWGDRIEPVFKASAGFNFVRLRHRTVFNSLILTKAKLREKYKKHRVD